MFTITALTVAGLLLGGGTHWSRTPHGVLLENLQLFEQMGGAGGARHSMEGGGALANGEELAVTTTGGLTPNADYRMVVVCDNACNDVDVGLYDSQNHALGEDRGPQAVAVAVFSAPDSGRFIFKIHIADCLAAQCGYGYRIYPAGSGW